VKRTRIRLNLKNLENQMPSLFKLPALAYGLLNNPGLTNGSICRRVNMSTSWIHEMDRQGLTPLDRAFKSGHMAVAEMMMGQEFLDQSANLNGATPLHRAALTGLTEAVEALLESGVDPMERDLQGEIPLHKAVRQGHIAVVELLLHDSDVNAVSDDGMSSLHWACLTGNMEVAHMLLTHEADPFLRDECLDGLTSMEIAGAMGFPELEQMLEERVVLV
jgi:ankyrin repeat protein